MANEVRDRLVELMEDIILSCKSSLCVDCEHLNVGYPHCMGVHFADHLIENGVIVPPCKVGDRIYAIFTSGGKIKSYIETYGDRITQIKINRGGYHFKCWWGYFHLSDIGKTVFLTKAEAEQKLKEMRGGNGNL